MLGRPPFVSQAWSFCYRSTGNCYSRSTRCNTTLSSSPSLLLQYWLNPLSYTLYGLCASQRSQIHTT